MVIDTEKLKVSNGMMSEAHIIYFIKYFNTCYVIHIHKLCNRNVCLV